MLNKKVNLLILIVVVISGYVLLSSSKSAAPINLQYELGFSINPSVNSGVVTFAIVGIDSATGNVITKEGINEGRFVMYGKGILKNKANPNQINFYEEVGIDCGIILDEPKMVDRIKVIDTLWEEMKPICLPVWDIWKLRYSIHPKYGQNGRQARDRNSVPAEDQGWSPNRWRPSYKQTLYLQKYGIKQIQDFFHGPKMFELFKDMQNDDWIRMYMELN